MNYIPPSAIPIPVTTGVDSLSKVGTTRSAETARIVAAIRVKIMRFILGLLLVLGN
jgi:hypothetical protein